MNDEKNIEMQAKIKKYSIAVCSVVLIFAIVAVAAVTSNDLAKEIETTTIAANEGVEAQLDNVPDTRDSETLIVPATEVTTVKQTVTTTVEETQEDTAPVSYILPLGTDIGNDYSMGVPVYNSVMGDWRTHDGVDFNGNYGDGVKAIADGTIKSIEADAVMGSTITVDHGGGVVATYCGVEVEDGLQRGLSVEQGDKLGTVTDIPGESDAEYPHLHLEIRVDGEICDPLEVMGYYE